MVWAKRRANISKRDSQDSTQKISTVKEGQNRETVLAAISRNICREEAKTPRLGKVRRSPPESGVIPIDFFFSDPHADANARNLPYNGSRVGFYLK